MTPIPLSYDLAIADVKERVRKSGTSFAAGMGVLPKTRKEAMYALYAFCREVDDIADDSPSPEIRDAGLKLWRERIRVLFHEKKAEDTICAALLPAIDRFDLVEADFQAIIDGMEMDAAKTICAPTLQELDFYCDHVASAVGRASVRIFGDASPEAMRVAHHLGRALQLTNILRDLAEDASRRRLYLPAELLARHNITSRDPAEVLRSPSLPALCFDLSTGIKHHYDEADKAMNRCQWQAMKPARLMRRYYGTIFHNLLKAGWKNPQQRVGLSFFQKIAIALWSLMG